MEAAWYEKQGPARDVLVVGTMPDPVAGAGEVDQVGNGVSQSWVGQRVWCYGAA